MYTSCLDSAGSVLALCYLQLFQRQAVALCCLEGFEKWDQGQE